MCPCRSYSCAKMSDICEQAYSPGSIRALFEGFRSQAENSLLFLKSVTELSVHVKAAGSQSPQLLFQATASAQVLSLIASAGVAIQIRTPECNTEAHAYGGASSIACKSQGAHSNKMTV